MWTSFGRFIFWSVIHPHLVEGWGILPDIRIKLESSPSLVRDIERGERYLIEQYGVRSRIKLSDRHLTRSFSQSYLNLSFQCDRRLTVNYKLYQVNTSTKNVRTSNFQINRVATIEGLTLRLDYGIPLITFLHVGNNLLEDGLDFQINYYP